MSSYRYAPVQWVFPGICDSCSVPGIVAFYHRYDNHVVAVPDQLILRFYTRTSKTMLLADVTTVEL